MDWADTLFTDKNTEKQIINIVFHRLFILYFISRFLS